MIQDVQILLVEDNASDAEMTIRALSKTIMASRLLRVKDGADALNFLFAEGPFSDRAIGATPKLVILDLKLPKVSGKEVLAKIKADERTRKIPVVILSSSREASDVKECYDLGANGYVVKPVESGAFSNAIAELGMYWTVINEPPQPRVLQTQITL
jgi:two-component system response regulator